MLLKSNWLFLWIESEWWVVILTFLLVVITSFYVLYTIRLWKTAQDSFTLERERHAMEMRPWIGVEHMQLNQDYKIYLVYKNFGKTPGYIRNTTRTLKIGQEIVDSAGPKKDQSILFPDQSIPSTGLTIIAPFIPQAEEKKLPLGFMIEIEYTDVEGNCEIYRENYIYNHSDNSFDLKFTFTGPSYDDDGEAQNPANSLTP